MEHSKYSDTTIENDIIDITDGNINEVTEYDPVVTVGGTVDFEYPPQKNEFESENYKPGPKRKGIKK